MRLTSAGNGCWQGPMPCRQRTDQWQCPWLGWCVGGKYEEIEVAEVVGAQFWREYLWRQLVTPSIFGQKCHLRRSTESSQPVKSTSNSIDPGGESPAIRYCLSTEHSAGLGHRQRVPAKYRSTSCTLQPITLVNLVADSKANETHCWVGEHSVQ